MAFRLKGEKTTAQLLKESEARSEELLRIIDQQKREIERLKLDHGGKQAIKSNLEFLDSYPRKGVWCREILGGRAGTVSR